MELFGLKGKGRQAVKQATKQLEMTTEKVIGLMVSAIFVMIEGIILLIAGSLTMGVAFYPALIATLWSVFLIILGALIVTVPILLLTGGVTATLAILLRNKTLRQTVTMLSKYGTWINIGICAFLIAALVTVGPLWLILTLVGTVVANFMLYLFMKPLRRAIRRVVRQAVPKASL